MRSTGSASQMNSFSIRTAFLMICWTSVTGNGFSNMVYNRQAKSQCMPSSREMSSFEKVSPGIKPRFFNQ